MRACDDRDLFAKDTIPDEIWEPMHNRSPNISIKDLINEWSFGESINNLRNL